MANLEDIQVKINVTIDDDRPMSAKELRSRLNAILWLVLSVSYGILYRIGESRRDLLLLGVCAVVVSLYHLWTADKQSKRAGVL